MPRQIVHALSTTLALGYVAGAFAQATDLDGVTMHVQEDVSGLDAVVIELDSDDGAGRDAPQGDDGAAADDENNAESEVAPEDPESGNTAGEPGAASE